MSWLVEIHAGPQGHSVVTTRHVIAQVLRCYLTPYPAALGSSSKPITPRHGYSPGSSPAMPRFTASHQGQRRRSYAHNCRRLPAAVRGSAPELASAAVVHQPGTRSALGAPKSCRRISARPGCQSGLTSSFYLSNLLRKVAGMRRNINGLSEKGMPLASLIMIKDYRETLFDKYQSSRFADAAY
jgi:hypothetical protein